MVFLVQAGKYVTISKTYLTTMGHYSVKFISNTETLKQNNIKYAQVFKADGILIKSVYLISMNINTDWYW